MSALTILKMVCCFDIRPTMLGIDPGEITDVEIEVVPKLGKLVHGAKDFRFVVSVTTADETTRTLIGETAGNLEFDSAPASRADARQPYAADGAW
jgi:hypothetical protein